MMDGETEKLTFKIWAIHYFGKRWLAFRMMAIVIRIFLIQMKMNNWQL